VAFLGRLVTAGVATASENVVSCKSTREQHTRRSDDIS
jgi:hypothetical protein